METTVMLNILDRLDWLFIRNRTFEAKRLLKQEIENLKGTTEKNCKKVKLRVDYCQICKNLNCNYNQNNIKDVE